MRFSLVMAQRVSSNLFIFTALLLYLAHHVIAATVQGPLGYVSIQSEPGYASARPCQAGCIIDNGRTSCGLNYANPKPQDDVRTALQCGCGAINACYCSEDLQSSATSWVHSCVSSRCSGVGDLDAAVTSMLSLYGGYCATANVQSSTPTRTGTPGGPVNTGSANNAAVAASETAAATGLAETSAGSAEANVASGEKADTEGLSKSDVVALAASLGVGIPSILLAVITLCVMVKKRKNAQTSGQGAMTYGNEVSEASVQPKYY